MGLGVKNQASVLVEAEGNLLGAWACFASGLGYTQVFCEAVHLSACMV